MKTKKRTLKSNHNITKKNGGSNGEIPCGKNEKGEKIKIVNETDVWYEVELENQKKYIRKKNILKID